MKKLIIFSIFLSTWYSGMGQLAPNKYFIEFTDKNSNPWSLDRPWEFLSNRALERRQNQGIGLEMNDLPITPSYVVQVAALGAQVLNRSKWMNGIIIFVTDTNILSSIRQLPFVKKIVINKSFPHSHLKVPDKFLPEREVSGLLVPESSWWVQTGTDQPYRITDYGMAWAQIHQLKGDIIHQMGYRGNGMIIAILDAGFLNANLLPAFDSLRANGQILGTRDFVNPGNSVYNIHSHGTAVLSTMGANLPGIMVGTAPKASFWLFRTEDGDSEYLIEEYNWVSGAEVADSAGADIINSSLGYTVFDNPLQNHTCADMDGNTTVVTRGANTAVAKGMIVCNSAGNYGSNPNWQCLSAPADGRSVVAVAAVDSLGNYASFSSKGQVTPVKVKPNVAAMGVLTAVCDPYGNVNRGSGTSFASPLIAGMLTCLWQACQANTNLEVIKAMEHSGNQFSLPDSLLGYGIPDFVTALSVMSSKEQTFQFQPECYPNPFGDELYIKVRGGDKKVQKIKLINLTGLIVYNAGSFPAGEPIIHIPTSHLKSGYYCLEIIYDHQHFIIPVIKVK
jgi:hypothetical protein